jgi:hypothetical protein
MVPGRSKFVNRTNFQMGTEIPMLLPEGLRQGVPLVPFPTVR